MSENERIKELRKCLDCTLEKFGQRLGVGKTAISKIERGENKLTEQMRKAICREFNVDYMWLTTGKGEMFCESDEDLLTTIDHIMFGENDFHKKILKFVAQMDDEDLIALEHLIDHASEFIQSDN